MRDGLCPRAAPEHFPPIFCSWAPCGLACHSGPFPQRVKNWARSGISQLSVTSVQGRNDSQSQAGQKEEFSTTYFEWMIFFLFCWKSAMEFLHSVPWIGYFPVIVSYLNPRSMKRNKNICNREGFFDSLPWKRFSEAPQRALVGGHEVFLAISLAHLPKASC